MSMKEEFPSGKLFVSYKTGLVEVVDEITAEVKKFASLDPKVNGVCVCLKCAMYLIVCVCRWIAMHTLCMCKNVIGTYVRR